jgi:predicted nucleic acid-binding protein
VPDDKIIVLDANIVLRAVLGQRVRALLFSYSNSVRFIAPRAAFAEVEEHLPSLLAKRGIPASVGAAVLQTIAAVIQIVDEDLYGAFAEAAKLRLAKRDADDWPMLATALALGCPIWTEDSDFFGAGIATWTTDRVELYLKSC